MESSCVEEEEEGMGGEGPMSGAEMVRVDRVPVDHELYTAFASYFCSACRVCDYDKFFVFAEYPVRVPKLELIWLRCDCFIKEHYSTTVFFSKLVI